MKRSNNKNPFEDLDKKFNTKEVTKALEENLKKTQEERQLPAVDMSEEDKDALLRKQQEEDLQYARSILKQAEAYNDEAIQGIMHIARNSDQPRAYEVAGQLIKTVSEVSQNLLDLQDKLKKVKEVPDKGPKNVTNALFVGSTTELQKMLKEKKWYFLDKN